MADVKPPLMFILETSDYGECGSIEADPEFSLYQVASCMVLEDPALWQAYRDAQAAERDALKALRAGLREMTTEERDARRKAVAAAQIAKGMWTAEETAETLVELEAEDADR